MITLVYPRTPQTMKSGGKSCPLGIQYLASYLIDNGIKTNVIDFTFTDWNEYENKLKELNSEFIGFSIQTPIAEDGLRAVEIARKVSPNSKIIVGGAHATVATKSLLENENIDFVVVGEGEKALLKIVSGQASGKIVQGEHIENLDELPFPKRELMNYEEYLKIGRSMELMVSRGCPFNCIFCQPTQRKLFGNKVRTRSPENVIEEIKYIIEKYGKNFIFFFLDDTFTWNEEWLEKFCNMVKPFKISWSCLTRVNSVDEKKLKMMKGSGCIYIAYGIESGSQKILNFMRKGITVEQIKEAFKLTHKTGILCYAFIIIGTPTETKEDLEMTVDLIKEIHPDGIQISIMTPLIGTDLDNYCSERKIGNIKNLSDYHYSMNNYPIKLENLTKEDISFYKKKIFNVSKSKKYKNYPKYIKMALFNRKMLFLFLKKDRI
ncbi:MAG: radical SAM protein [Candidatus Aenigmatarchaeota archaeon]